MVVEKQDESLVKNGLVSYHCLFTCIFEENLYGEHDLAIKPQTISKFLKGTESQGLFNEKALVKMKKFAYSCHSNSNRKCCLDFLVYSAEQSYWGQFFSRLSLR